MNLYIQYILTAVIVIFAIGYIVKLIKETFSKKKDKDGCGNNCGCK